MKLTILGSGTSCGVPQLLCNCNVCRSTDPHDRRLRTSALVEFNGKNLLLDCGPDFREQMLRLGSPHLDALLVTHHHYDHLGGIDDLRPYCVYNPDGFPIFCRSDVAGNIHQRMSYCFGNNKYPGSPRLDLHVIDTAPFHPFTDIEITPLPVMHTSTLQITGFRIGPLSYVTDCKVMPESTLKLMHGTDTLIINALRPQPHPSHLCIDEALSIISKITPRLAILTHFSHEVGLYAEVNASLPAGVMMAYDGMTLEI